MQVDSLLAEPPGKHAEARNGRPVMFQNFDESGAFSAMSVVGGVEVGKITQTWNARLIRLDGAPVAEDVWKGVKHVCMREPGVPGVRLGW